MPGSKPGIAKRFASMEENMAVSDNAKTFLEGLKAFEAGVKQNACPYDPKSEQAYEWASGWNMGEVLLQTPPEPAI